MTAVEHYVELLEDGPFDGESITVLIAAGASQQEVADALGVDLAADPTEWPEADDEQFSAYAIADVPGGVVAVETSGYADPTLTALRQLSVGGRSVAVVRDNIQAHLRFGCARDGELVFDDDEFMYVDDPTRMPAELKPLFDTVWTDGEQEPDEDVEPLAVALAMAETFTGLRVSAEDWQLVADSGYRIAPSLVYPG
jgi:hypothetical protein